MARGNELNAISNNTAVSRETGVLNKLFKTAEIAYKKQLVNYEIQKQLANELKKQQQVSQSILGETQKSSKKNGEMFKNTIGFLHKSENMAFKALSNLIKFIKKDFSEIKGWLRGHMDDILKPISAIVDPIKALWKDIFKTDSTEKNTEKTALTLDDMFKWMKMSEEDRMKWEKYNTDGKGEKKKGWKLMLGVLVFIAGVIAGSLYKVYQTVFKPITTLFSFLGKGLKSLGLFIGELVAGTKWGATLIKSISNFIGEGGMLSKVFGLLGKVGAVFTNLFAPIKTFFMGFKTIAQIFSSIGSFFKEISVLGKIFRLGFSVGKGIPVIGWVITGIMAVIDFFTGFNKTEGDIFEKITGGLESAVMGFIEPFIMIAEWIGSLTNKIKTYLPKWAGGGSNKIGDNTNFAGNKSFGTSTLPSITNIAPTTGTMLGIKKKDNSVDFSGLNPTVGSKFFGMAAEYQQLTGKQIQVNSAYRSPEAQAKLWDGGRNPNAAPPGRSLHEKGLAIDINSSNANELQSLGLFDKYGFTRPMSHEPWHIQPIGARSMTGTVESKSGAPAMIATGSMPSSSAPSPTGSIGSTASSASAISPYAVPSALAEAPNVDASRAGTMSATASGSEMVASSVGAMSKDVKRQTDVSTGVGNMITSSMGAMSGSISSGESTIPTDIESLSILLYNKSWGMG